MKKSLYALLGLLVSFNVSAITLQQAKSQGLVGERNDGYLGYVKKPASDEVKQLVKSVNNKRKAKFEQTASKAGATLKQVEMSFHQRAVKATKPGLYVQDASGKWVKK